MKQDRKQKATLKTSGTLKKETPVSSFAKEKAIRISVSIALLMGIIAVMIALNTTDPDAVMTSARKQQYAAARVSAVLLDDAKPDFVRSEGRRLGKQELEVLITQGRHKGETMRMTNYLSALGNVDVKVGTRIIVRMAYNDDGTYYPTMHNYNRGIVLTGVILLSVAALAIIGGKKGIMAMAGILFTIACLWLILVPLIIRGVNPVLSTVAIIAVTASASLILLDGFTRKSISAILGSISGATAAGITAALVGIIAPLSGFNMGEAEELMLRSTGKDLTISGLLVCGILIASLGAVMDVAMSISSAISELHDLNPEISRRQLFKSGMNIGRDALGATANTLILAIVGSSLNVFILTRLLDIPFIQLVNSDFIVIEILQGVIGAFGIILTVPFVALFSSYLVYGKLALK